MVNASGRRRTLRIHNGTVNALFASLIGLILILVTNNPTVHVIAIWAVAVYASAIVRFDFIHPYCWFSLTFALYNTAYTLLYILNYDRSAGYSTMNAVYTMVAMGIVLLIVGAGKVDRETPLKRIYSVNSPLNDTAFFVFAVLSIAFSLILQMRGYSGKSAMKAAGDVYYALGVHVVRWMLVMMVIQLCASDCANRKKNRRYIVVALAAALAMTLFTGERDILFRAILLIVFVLFYFRRLRNRHLLYLIPAGIFIMVLSVYIKYYFLTGVLNKARWSSNLLYQFLMTDFHATGRNTQFLLDNDWTKGYWGFKLFFSELIRGLIPFVTFNNPSTWYNYEVYPGTFKGQAFTLVGFGHVIHGILGVVLVFVFLGLFIWYTYHRSRSSLYSLAFYLYSISIVAGCYRQTLNTVVNMSIKAVLVIVLLSRLLGKVYIRQGVNDGYRVLRKSRLR